MTQHQNTELLPCPFCGEKPISCHQAFGDNDHTGKVCQTEGCVLRWQEFTDTQWNTRRAKAVQGDKGVVSKLNNLEACVYETVLHYKDPNFSRRSQSDVMEKLENAYDDIPALRAALTPESEGIAGKGDLASNPKPFWDRFYYHLGGWDTSKDSLIQKMENAAESAFLDLATDHTLTRPQEIDVSEFKMKKTVGDLKTPFDVGYMHGYNAAIDYLSSSGYLSAPDGKE